LTLPIKVGLDNPEVQLIFPRRLVLHVTLIHIIRADFVIHKITVTNIGVLFLFDPVYFLLFLEVGILQLLGFSLYLELLLH
jgi:hypothetical protein